MLFYSGANLILLDNNYDVIHANVPSMNSEKHFQHTRNLHRNLPYNPKPSSEPAP